jgi:uncharacterized protein YceK
MKKILLIFFIIAISGCASITGSKNQPLSVTATLDGKPVVGANCELLNDKGKWFVTTPGSVVILKSYQDLTVTCRKQETRKFGTTTFKSTNEGSVWGNIITGGVIGYAVDAGTGAGFSYPPTLNVPMVYGDAIPPLPEKKKNTDLNNMQK